MQCIIWQKVEPELIPDPEIYIFFENRDSHITNEKVKVKTSIWNLMIKNKNWNILVKKI